MVKYDPPSDQPDVKIGASVKDKDGPGPYFDSNPNYRIVVSAGTDYYIGHGDSKVYTNASSIGFSIAGVGLKVTYTMQTDYDENHRQWIHAGDGPQEHDIWGDEYKPGVHTASGEYPAHVFYSY